MLRPALFAGALPKWRPHSDAGAIHEAQTPHRAGTTLRFDPVKEAEGNSRRMILQSAERKGRVSAMRSPGERKTGRAWRKSRVAARLLIRKEAGRMSRRDRELARQLSQDPEVTNRLIQQAL